MKLSVVIPAFNEERLLGETLERVQAALKSVHGRGWETEIVVCDNNSTDRTASIATQPGVTVVFEPINQIGRARNRGATAATGDWLLFVDADSHPSSELLLDLVDAMEDPRCIGGGANVTFPPGCKKGAKWVRLWNWLSRVTKWAPGSFIFCRTEAFRTLGGFSRELFISEEIDLSKRLKRLAATRGQRMIILSRHPLLTSDRKLGLYSDWEHVKFVWRYFSAPKATSRNREACDIWYDGRR